MGEMDIKSVGMGGDRYISVPVQASTTQTLDKQIQNHKHPCCMSLVIKSFCILVL